MNIRRKVHTVTTVYYDCGCCNVRHSTPEKAEKCQNLHMAKRNIGDIIRMCLQTKDFSLVASKYQVSVSFVKDVVMHRVLSRDELDILRVMYMANHDDWRLSAKKGRKIAKELSLTYNSLSSQLNVYAPEWYEEHIKDNA